jgi:hypothetical protein
MSDSESYSAPNSLWVLRQARHAAVQAVEHHGDEDRHRGVLEAPVHRLHDGVESRRTAPRGEQVGQDVDAAARFSPSRAAGCDSTWGTLGFASMES